MRPEILKKNREEIKEGSKIKNVIGRRVPQCFSHIRLLVRWFCELHIHSSMGSCCQFILLGKQKFVLFLIQAFFILHSYPSPSTFPHSCFPYLPSTHDSLSYSSKRVMIPMGSQQDLFSLRVRPQRGSPCSSQWLHISKDTDINN